MEKIYESKSLYRIEYELIKSVQKLRQERGWSQEVLSLKMKFASTFVGKCESLDQPEKYNLRHIGILKEIFELQSLDELFPQGIPADEQIIIRYKKAPKKKADGKPSKLMDNEIIETIIIDAETKAEGNKNRTIL